MNFLAHLHLSPGGDLVRVGNFMADAVKGRDLSAYPDELAHGIRLHRAIDQFTDSHPEVRAFRRHFSPHLRHYSAVAQDVLFDHYLAARWSDLGNGQPLPDFAQTCYAQLLAAWEFLPERTRRMTDALVRENWLEAYATEAGTHGILQQMSRRTLPGNGLDRTMPHFSPHRSALEIHFDRFWPELSDFVTAYSGGPGEAR
jgi:acyl carrier protein phosphodiesterase